MRNFFVRIAGALMRSMPFRLSRFLVIISDFLRKIGTISFIQKSLQTATLHADQESLLREIAKKCGSQVIYMEFGVWRGDSMKTAIDIFGEKDALFYGFDSFEGLPDHWNRYFGSRMSAGTFDTAGMVPNIRNNRVKFIKGWFENTLPEFLRAYDVVSDDERDLVLYLDADLYKPTLFVLHRIAAYRDRFFALCDDWTGGTGQAVYEFAETSKFKLTFLGQLRSPVHGLPIKTSLILERQQTSMLDPKL